LKAIVHGKAVTVTHGVLENATLLIDAGKIIGIGTDLKIPEEAEVIDASNCWVTPGLIDCHTHLSTFSALGTNPGVKDGNEYSDPVTPHVRAIDALNPYDEAFPIVRKAGFTTCYTGPGSANVIGGMGISIKLRGHTAEEMAIPGSEQMKFALGENPKRFYGLQNKMPVTRMGTAALIRETLAAARNYSDKLLKAERGEGDKPEFNFKLESLVQAVRGQMRCRIHCHRSDDIVTAIRIAKEFHLDYTLEHATEGYKVADFLARENATCVIGPLMLPPNKMELWEAREETSALLEKAGVNICLTADGATETQWLPTRVGVIMRFGLPEQAALEAVTIRPARVMGLQDRIGSLETGKDADISVFDGHPFSNMTSCVLTMIDGIVYHNAL
jgi:imidazolonepropionase-like amidohydrolase